MYNNKCHKMGNETFSYKHRHDAIITLSGEIQIIFY